MEPGGHRQYRGLLSPYASPPTTTLPVENTTNVSAMALSMPTSFSSATSALRRFMKSFDALVEKTNRRMQLIGQDRLRVLYDETNDVPISEQNSLSVASSELASALQRDLDAPGRMGVRGSPQPTLSPELDDLAATAKPMPRACPSELSERSVDVSIAFPVLSVGSSMTTFFARRRPSPDRESQENTRMTFTAPDGPLQAEFTKISVPQTASVDGLTELRGTTPVPPSESTPALPGPFNEVSSYASRTAPRPLPDRAGYTRFLMFTQRLLHDPTISTQVRNQWVDELVNSSLTLFKLSESLYESASSLGDISPGVGLFDAENNMASVLPVQDSPMLLDLNPPHASPPKISRRQVSHGMGGGYGSPLDVPMTFTSNPGSFAAAGDLGAAGQSVSFVRNRRESCPSYDDGSTTSSLNSNAVEMLNHYYVMKRLGVGTTATVSLCVDQKNRQPYAVKSMPVPRKSNLHARLRHFSHTSDDIALMSMSEAPARTVPEVPAVSRQEREIRVMRRLRHCPYVARLHEVIDDEEENMVHLIMTLAEGGVLTHVHPYDHRRKCVPCAVVRPLSRVSRYGRQVLAALAGLQQQRIIHNDIKPDNVLITSSDTVVLSDFGESVLMPPNLALNPNASISAYFPAANASVALLSRRGMTEDYPFGATSGFDPNFMPDSSMFLSPGVGRDGKITGQAVAGTPAFSAPELIESNMCSYASDVWSFGVLMYAIVFGQLPFAGPSVAETYRAILENPLVFPEYAALPADAQMTQTEYDQWVALCRAILNRDPLRRPTVRALTASPLFANTPSPPASALSPLKSASVASQKILNALLSAKEHAASHNNNHTNNHTTHNPSISSILCSPPQFSTSPPGNGGGFLTEVSGLQSLSSRSQVAALRVTSPPKSMGVSNSGTLNVAPPALRRSVPTRSVSGAEAATPYTSTPPAPPLRTLSNGKLSASAGSREGDRDTGALADSIPSVLLEYQKEPAASAVVVAAAESPTTEDVEESVEAASPPSLPSTRTSRLREDREGKKGDSYTPAMEHGPIVSFLEDSHSMDGMASTTGRRLQRSTATTAAYHDEDPFGSRFSSRTGGRSTLGSRTVTTVPSTSRVGLDSEGHSLNDPTNAERPERPTTGSSSGTHHDNADLLHSLTNSVDAPPHAVTIAASSVDETRHMPVIFSPHGGSATTDGTMDSNSITSFRDPTSGSSAPNLSAVDHLSQSLNTDHGFRHRNSSLPRKRVLGDHLRAPSAVTTSPTALNNASFRSVAIMSEAEAVPSRAHSRHARRRGRRRNASGASLSDSDMLDGPAARRLRTPNARVEEATADATDLIHARTPARYVQLSHRETVYIQALNASLCAMCDDGTAGQDAPLALAAAVADVEETARGSHTLPPQPRTKPPSVLTLPASDLEADAKKT